MGLIVGTRQVVARDIETREKVCQKKLTAIEKLILLVYIEFIKQC